MPEALGCEEGSEPEHTGPKSLMLLSGSQQSSSAGHPTLKGHMLYIYSLPPVHPTKLSPIFAFGA